ncbi:hypothetical protein ACUDTH_02890 [Stenotrophomonas pavanii]|uniref:hypothetical protein n=1 Tax=Stenotrophomonas pavanii TaxID=487698 RepID=UPI004042E1D0
MAKLDDESLTLMFDPFDGDFGSPGDKVLSDKMVTGRKEHNCSHCSGHIAVGERHRSRVEVVDGSMMSHRWCRNCCSLMARIVGGRDPESAEDEFEGRIGAHRAKAVANG